MPIGAIFSSLLAIVLSLAFVIGLAWGILWLLKRFQDGSFGKLGGNETGRSLRFERALPIGPRERLVLVDVDGEQMLLGVTAHSITSLKSWPVEEDGADDETPHPQNVDSAKVRRFRLRMAEGAAPEEPRGDRQ